MTVTSIATVAAETSVIKTNINDKIQNNTDDYFFFLISIDFVEGEEKKENDKSALMRLRAALLMIDR